MDPRTADERYLIDPNDYSDAPGYAYHSLSWHAARIAVDERKARRNAARDRARARGLSVKAAA